MISELPWAIWSEIIDYAFLIKNEYCFVNKKWFVQTVGQRDWLTCERLSREQPYDWFKLFKNIELTEYSKINWDFLDDCCMLKSAEIHLGLEKNPPFHKLRAFIWNSRLEHIFFIFPRDDMIRIVQNFLKGLNSHNSILSVACFRLDLGNFFQQENPFIEELNIFSDAGKVNFSNVHKYIINARKMELRIFDLGLRYRPIGCPTFKHLKSLTLSNIVFNELDNSDILFHLFQYNFPILTSFVLKTCHKKISLNLISKSMPALKLLTLYMRFSDATSLLFPFRPLVNLEGLIFEYSNTKGCDILTNIDLSKLPQLRNLEINSAFRLSNSDTKHYPLVAGIKLKGNIDLPYQVILDALPRLSKININCSKLNSKHKKLLYLFTKVTKLTLTELDRPLKLAYSSQGSFKTTHLKIKGGSYLTNDLLKWLANQPQLISLNLYYNSNDNLVLNYTQFPYLKELKIKSWPKEREADLRSVFLTRFS